MAQSPMNFWPVRQAPMNCPPCVPPYQQGMPGYPTPAPGYSMPSNTPQMQNYSGTGGSYGTTESLGQPAPNSTDVNGRNAQGPQDAPFNGTDTSTTPDPESGLPQISEAFRQAELNATPPMTFAGPNAQGSAPTGQEGQSTPNMMGDFFGSQGGRVNLFIPFRFDGVSSVPIGPGAFGFNLNGAPGLDVFTVGPADADGAFNIAEPVNPTGALLPTDFGLNGFNYAGGTATAPDVDGLSTVSYAFSQEFLLPTSSTSLLGLQKIAENVSPLPRDRYFFNYSYFDETPLAGTTNVHRWSPGFEKTICGGNMVSIEVRLPMAVTLNNRIDAAAPDREHFELGNIFAAYKLLLYEDRSKAIAIGLAVTVPTAQDINVFVRGTAFGQPNNPTERQVLKVDNQSVHVMPYIGGLIRHGQFFQQGFVQVDVDVNGSPVFVNTNFTEDGLERAGRFQDQPFIYVDYQAGFWLTRGGRNSRLGITGIAPIGEIHVNRSLNASDSIKDPTTRSDLFSINQDNQIVNVLAGVTFEYNFDTHLTLGYSTPIGNRSDAEFDGELRVLLNRFF